MKNYKLILVITFCFLTANAFSQNIWYVSENGNDSSGNGSENNPWATISKALNENSVLDNDSIYIIGTITGDGEAEWGIQVMKDIIFIGESKETSIIQAAPSSSIANRRVFTIWDIADVQLINLSIKNGYFNSSSFQYGAGILNWGNLSISNCIIANNYCETEFLGGGIYNQFGNLNLVNTYVNSNYSIFGGAGITNEGGTLVLENSSFALNYCQQNLSGGGGLYITNAANVSIVNCTFYYNLLGLNSFGSGIYIKASEGNVNLDIINTTIADNEAGSGSSGLGIFIENETTNTVSLSLKNCILSNGSFSNFGQSGGGNIQVNRSYSLCQDASLPNGNTNGNIDNSDPLIENFMNHGGLTPTCSIEQTSPAINSGTDIDAPDYDQRGMPRSQLTDMGSFEYQINTGIIKKPQNNTIYISPNPTHGFLKVSYLGNEYQLLQVCIYNSLGEKLLQCSKQSYYNQIHLDVSKLEKGIYFVELLSGEKRLGARSFICK